VGLGRMFPEKNFIGVDMKGNRIWVGAKTAIKENLKNVGFIRSHIDKLADYFQAGEVAEIWLPFPDPQLRTSKIKKRLTHPKFLRLYQSVLAPGGVIHLKTDSPELYKFTKEVIILYNLTVNDDIEDVHSQSQVSDVLKIQTHYERLDIARSGKIYYLQFVIPHESLPNKDNELKELLREEATDRRN
jgi:tRNA (guanine-N7-)-methyltransferase